MYNTLEACKKAKKEELKLKLTYTYKEKFTSTYATILTHVASDIEDLKFSVVGGILYMASTDSSLNQRVPSLGVITSRQK